MTAFTDSKAFSVISTTARRVLNTLMFYTQLVSLALVLPYVFLTDSRNSTGPTWGMSIHLGNNVRLGFEQNLWQFGSILATLFFWWAAAYLWRNRKDGLFA